MKNGTEPEERRRRFQTVNNSWYAFVEILLRQKVNLDFIVILDHKQEIIPHEYDEDYQRKSRKTERSGLVHTSDQHVQTDWSARSTFKLQSISEVQDDQSHWFLYQCFSYFYAFFSHTVGLICLTVVCLAYQRSRAIVLTCCMWHDVSFHRNTHTYISEINV